MSQVAVGFVETRGLVGVIEAADAAVKAARVEIAGFEPVGGGLVAVRFTGDVASVQAAVQAAVEAARQVSEVISHHVIPAPHADLTGLLGQPRQPLSTAQAEDSATRPSSAETSITRRSPGKRIAIVTQAMTECSSSTT